MGIQAQNIVRTVILHAHSAQALLMEFVVLAELASSFTDSSAQTHALSIILETQVIESASCATATALLVPTQQLTVPVVSLASLSMAVISVTQIVFKTSSCIIVSVSIATQIAQLVQIQGVVTV